MLPPSLAPSMAGSKSSFVSGRAWLCPPLKPELCKVDDYADIHWAFFENGIFAQTCLMTKR
jgi:hypothetical protein